MRIVVIGPYSAPTKEETQANVDRATRIGLALMHKGHGVFIPHLYHYLATLPECTLTYDDWMWTSMSFIFALDAVFYIGPSPGTDRELEYAETLDKYIFRRIAYPDL